MENPIKKLVLGLDVTINFKGTGKFYSSQTNSIYARADAAKTAVLPDFGRHRANGCIQPISLVHPTSTNILNARWRNNLCLIALSYISNLSALNQHAYLHHKHSITKSQ